MGKQTRKEREEKRDSYASQRSRQKRKNVLIASGIFGIIIAIVGISAYNFVAAPPGAPGSPEGAGILGDEHEHAAILAMIHGDRFDFSSAAYQIKSSWIHFEMRDGTTIHRHSSGVTMGFLFESLGLIVNEECYIFKNGREFCTDDVFGLQYYINGEKRSDIDDYVLDDEDRILIVYGDETQEEVQQYIDELAALPILA